MSRVSERVRRQVLERAGGRCQGVKADGEGCGADVVALAAMPARYLRKYLPKGAAAFEIDHIRPYSDSEDNSLENLEVLCGWCHREKSDGERPEYARGERSHTLDRVQPRRGRGAPGLARSDRLGRVLQRRFAQAGGG